MIALEKLNLRAMTRSAKGSVERPGRNVRGKAGLNRRLLDSGFGLLRQMIVAKAEEAAYGRRRFCCVGSGHRNHSDVNAALVIRGRAQLGAQEWARPGRGSRGQGAAA
ncbi:MAG: hypothetical protein ABSF08_11665 [Candidatus Cybelea sp.]